MEQLDVSALGTRAWGRLADALDGRDPAGLDDAAELFGDALAAGTGHPDEVCWHYGLGLAAAAAAEQTADLRRWDQARDEIHQAWRAPAHLDIDRDEVAADLAWVLVSRFDAAGHDPSDLGTLVADLDAIRADVPGVVMLRGMARLHRAWAEESVPDHEAGRELLAAALPAVDDGAPLLLQALADYASACDDIGDVDPGLDALRRARSLIDPGQPAIELDLIEGHLSYTRWVLADDETAGDVARECLERVCEGEDPPPTALLRCAELWSDRGNRTGSLPDLDTAVRRLDAAVLAVDDSDAGMAWLTLGMTHQRRGELGADVDHARAASCFDAALRHGLDDADLVLDAHRWRLEMLDEVLRAGPSDEMVAAAITAHEEGIEALDTAGSAGEGLRAELAMAILRTEIDLFNPAPHTFDRDRMHRLLATARRHPEPHEEWQSLVGIAKGFLQMVDDLMAGRAGGHGDFGVGAFARTARESGHPDVLGPDLARMAALGSVLDASRTGDLGKLDAAALLDGSDGDTTGGFLAAFAELGKLNRRGAPAAEQLAAHDRLMEAVHAMAAADPQDRWISEYQLPFFQAMREMIAPSGKPLPVQPPRTLRGPLADLLDSVTGTAAAGAAIAAAADDPGRQRDELLALESRVAGLPTGSPQHGMAAHTLAIWWLHRAERTHRPDDIEHAVRWCEAASAFDAGPENPLWVQSAMQAAQARRLRGTAEDRARSRELGLAALRGHAWMVLLQSGTEHAVTMARSAAADALRIARWCVHDRVADDLVAALDAGRGLVLHAAVTTRGVGERLRLVGRDDLADEWTLAGGDDSVELLTTPDAALRGDLRRRVLTALTATDSGLLDPPSTPQIRAALQAQGSAALVYLVPADGPEPGLAVVVPAAEPVEVLELPDLGTGPELRHYGEAYTAWHHPEEPQPAEDRRACFETWRARLTDLTRWAWRVAGAELAELAHRLPPGTGEDPPHLVLAPFGTLALVPWHAAAGPEGSGDLADAAVVSTTPSARLLCQAVTRHTGVDGAQLVIGNPSGDLRAAGAEARALVAAFYPEATYLGQPGDGVPDPDGTGSAVEVLDRLRDGSPSLSVLHLACHARAEPAAPGRSSLRLADRWLEVDEILAVRPTQPFELDTVQLAACSTIVSGADYDEAFSLATAFLAAGARTAYGSMWTVPDRYTSRLMFMVHHYRRVEGCTPAVALHRARRWSRDPHRVPPDGMPPALAASWRSALPSDDPVAWAGCLHVGA
ncbi:CHAT domain-containing protein [Pseudonocardia sp. 73-21]|uniref:CHAT domain-containing protein n=1 Tax=Pseudonocardia sp. 73-21 TaxID=1895809 RepID=UPI000963CAD8|nr:CHAT domain-containing protein [Pseudonocardia sp. 73-21]OJY45947.1 MAG: hypothetical protein BGP03_31275 [Pseudonocardia sp. 73-21]